MKQDLTSWSRDQLLTSLGYIVDDIIETMPGFREELMDLEDVILSHLCQEAGLPREDNDKLPEPDKAILLSIISNLVETPEFSDKTKKWIDIAPDDRSMGLDPLTGTIIAAAIYFIFTTNFKYVRKTSRDDSSVKWTSTFKISRKKDVDQGFIRALLNWFRGNSE